MTVRSFFEPAFHRNGGPYRVKLGEEILIRRPDHKDFIEPDKGYIVDVRDGSVIGRLKDQVATIWSVADGIEFTHYQYQMELAAQTD